MIFTVEYEVDKQIKIYRFSDFCKPSVSKLRQYIYSQTGFKDFKVKSKTLKEVIK